MKTPEISRAAPLATEIANHRKFQMISRNCLTGYFWGKIRWTAVSTTAGRMHSG
jgi:hypothetical protein